MLLIFSLRNISLIAYLIIQIRSYISSVCQLAISDVALDVTQFIVADSGMHSLIDSSVQP